MDNSERAEILICGAGIAGVSSAYHLAVRKGLKNIYLVDQFAPLSLTSDRSSECYRNWWPGPGDGMVALMNRSIDIMEDLADKSGNAFHLNRRGYLYCTADQSKIDQMQQDAENIAALGAGPLRIHAPNQSSLKYRPSTAHGYKDQPDGADLILDLDLIRAHFPYLSNEIVAALHVRRAGWFSAQQLGMYLLGEARQKGVKVLRGRINNVEQEAGRVIAANLDDGRRIQCSAFVNAAGPFLNHVARMIDIDLPVHNELHLKMAIKDERGVLSRTAPLVIWSDVQLLDWTHEERQFLENEAELRWMLDQMPPGVHTRPEGGGDSPIILILWEYHKRLLEPVWPIPIDETFPEIALRGLTNMLPDIKAYLDKLPKPQIDGGYYTKTKENRPLIGPLPVEGAYVIGAMSGFGLMAACGAGELLAAHMTGTSLPHYAAAFMIDRYTDPAYRHLLQNLEETGQL
jgi:glycine/D-amino acid oxidase-like deaminating enzyme